MRGLEVAKERGGDDTAPPPPPPPSQPEITLTTAPLDDNLVTPPVIVVIKESSIPDIHITGKETDQNVVDKFNAYYRRHKRLVEAAGDSLSSIGISHSQLIRSRECRMITMRRILIFFSLCFWASSLMNTTVWYLIMYIWPRHFAVNDFAHSFYGVDIDAPQVSYTILGVTALYTYILGTWGLISATCGQEGVLKRFMLTTPWFLLISITCGFTAISFVGDLSQEKFKKVMDIHLGLYYHPNRHQHNLSRDGWDTMQLYLRCCGIDNAGDWLKVNHNPGEKVPWSCCKNKHGRRETNTTLVASCVKDALPHQVFSVGCKEKGFEFQMVAGAGVTADYCVTIILNVLVVMVAHRFYSLKKFGHYRYPIKEYLIDFLYIRKCVTIFRKKRRLKHATAGSSLNPGAGAANGPTGGGGGGGGGGVKKKKSVSSLDEEDYSALEKKLVAEEEEAEALQLKEAVAAAAEDEKHRNQEGLKGPLNHRKSEGVSFHKKRKDVNVLYHNSKRRSVRSSVVAPERLHRPQPPEGQGRKPTSDNKTRDMSPPPPV